MPESRVDLSHRLMVAADLATRPRWCADACTAVLPARVSHSGWRRMPGSLVIHGRPPGDFWPSRALTPAAAAVVHFGDGSCRACRIGSPAPVGTPGWLLVNCSPSLVCYPSAASSAASSRKHPTSRVHDASATARVPTSFLSRSTPRDKRFLAFSESARTSPAEILSVSLRSTRMRKSRARAASSCARNPDTVKSRALAPAKTNFRCTYNRTSKMCHSL